jgi:hypothetical protein
VYVLPDHKSIRTSEEYWDDEDDSESPLHGAADVPLEIV